MKPLIVLGTGGTCLDIAEAAELSGLTVAGFLDDHLEPGSTYAGFPILGRLEDAPKLKSQHVFCNGIGSPRSFRAKHTLIAKTGLALEDFIVVRHPTASVSPRACIQPGCALLQHTVVAANAKLEPHVVVLPTSVVSHDSTIGAYTCIAGGVIVSGHVSVAESCYLGAGSVIRDGVSIGAQTLIGMGAVVTKDVMDGAVVVGNPGRVK